MFLLKLRSELQNLFKKFAVQYENTNKLQTAFPRSGILPGMHRGGGDTRGYQQTGGPWSQEEKMTHIDILELKTVHLGILTFTKFKIAQRIHVQMDNKVALSYLVRWGNLNDDLLSLSKQIWDYLLSKKIAVIAEYLLGNLNVTADWESWNFQDDSD